MVSAGLTAGVAWLLTCWLLGRLVLHLPLRASLHVVFDLLGSVVKDFGHPEGIKANRCFFVISVVIPVAIVWYMDLTVGRRFLLFCLGWVFGPQGGEVIKAISKP